MIQPIKKEMRRQASCLERTMRDLEALQRRLLAGLSDADVTAMSQGRRSLSPDAHFVAVLQSAVVEAEKAARTLRVGALEETLQRIDRSWRKGDPPDARALEAVQAARWQKGGPR